MLTTRPPKPLNNQLGIILVYVTPFILVLIMPSLFLRTLPTPNHVPEDLRNFPAHRMTSSSISQSCSLWKVTFAGRNISVGAVWQLRCGPDCAGSLVRFLVEAIGSSVPLTFQTISWIHLAPQSLFTGGNFHDT
jgi:hypothetical protein